MSFNILCILCTLLYSIILSGLTNKINGVYVTDNSLYSSFLKLIIACQYASMLYNHLGVTFSNTIYALMTMQWVFASMAHLYKCFYDFTIYVTADRTTKENTSQNDDKYNPENLKYVSNMSWEIASTLSIVVLMLIISYKISNNILKFVLINLLGIILLLAQYLKIDIHRYAPILINILQCCIFAATETDKNVTPVHYIFIKALSYTSLFITNDIMSYTIYIFFTMISCPYEFYMM